MEEEKTQNESKSPRRMSVEDSSDEQQGVCLSSLKPQETDGTSPHSHMDIQVPAPSGQYFDPVNEESSSFVTNQQAEVCLSSLKPQETDGTSPHLHMDLQVPAPSGQYFDPVNEESSSFVINQQAEVCLSSLKPQETDGTSPHLHMDLQVPAPSGQYFDPVNEESSSFVINQQAESFGLIPSLVNWKEKVSDADMEAKESLSEEAELLANKQRQEAISTSAYEHEDEEISWMENIFGLIPLFQDPENDDGTGSANKSLEPSAERNENLQMDQDDVENQPSAERNENLQMDQDDVENQPEPEVFGIEPDAAGEVREPAIDPLKVKKVRKPAKQAFRCLTCCITYFSEKQYNSHLQGKRHKKTLRFKENNPEAERNENDDGFSVRDGRSCCKFCNVTVTGIRQLKQHLKGRKHKNQKKRIKKIRNDNNSSGFEVFQPRVNLYYCSDCRTSITGEIPYVDHMHGKRHRRAVRIRRMGHF